MDHAEAEALRRSHPAWRLLRAEHAPLVIAFLHRTFIAPNVRTLAQPELASKLEDFLFDLRRTAGDAAYPRPAVEYLDDWASDEKGFLRKYYAEEGDEPHFDLTPAAEKALEFVVALGERQLVSTESRLLTVFELLRQLTEGTLADPEAHAHELERRRAAIDAEIARLREGHVDLMEPAQIKDRFLQLAATARGLLSDFRALEQSFRDLDRGVRERIATWEGGKGELLDDVLGERDAIADSDQGRSFRAFWDFLMSPARQEELTARLATVLALPAVQELSPDPRLLRIHYDWLDAGEVAQRTVARLSEQLRRYLDDRAFLENRRIMELIRSVEQHALGLREDPPAGPFMELDEAAPAIELPFERPLYAPPHKPEIRAEGLLAGVSDLPPDALYDQVYVDRAALHAHVRRALQTRSQVTLAELLELRPLTLGLAELVAYFALAADDRDAVIDDARAQRVSFRDAEGRAREATLPLVVFTRRGPPRATP
jgi:flagellar motility protein MotE (MotC chaperone)